MECVGVWCSLLQFTGALYCILLYLSAFYNILSHITHSFTSLFIIPHSYTLLHISHNSATPYHPSPHSIRSLFTIWYSINPPFQCTHGLLNKPITTLINPEMMIWSSHCFDPISFLPGPIQVLSGLFKWLHIYAEKSWWVYQISAQVTFLRSFKQTQIVYEDEYFSPDQAVTENMCGYEAEIRRGWKWCETIEGI